MVWLAAPPDLTSTGRYTERRPCKLGDVARERLIAERAEGATLRELAMRFGVSAEAVRLVLKRMEVA
jgi:transposase